MISPGSAWQFNVCFTPPIQSLTMARDLEKKTVLVVGGGFAGREAYRKLKKSFNVTMVDSRGFFEYTPSILRCLVEPSHASKIIVPHHASVTFTAGEVIEIKSEDSAGTSPGSCRRARVAGTAHFATWPTSCRRQHANQCHASHLV